VDLIHPEGLCTLIPVERGREGQLRRRLRGMPRGPRSPMIRVRGTHYARWAIVKLRDKRGRELETEPAYLLFATEFDGSVDAYVRRLCAKLGQDAHEIWCHCAGYPGRDADELAQFLLEHRVRPGYSVVAYPGVSVGDVRAAFALRERLNDFLVRTATLDSRALHQAWEARFRARAR
jgi:hypothetical protein